MSTPRVLAEAPEELTKGKLRRLGEGIGKVVYASEHWVVKRERSPFSIVALVVLWKLLRRVQRLLPGKWGRRIVERPAKQIRLMRVLLQATMLVVPKSVWFTTHVRGIWAAYHKKNVRGEELSKQHLVGTALIPETVTFPPVRVRVGGWPGWLTVSEATERVEATLSYRLEMLAAQGRFDELEEWLDRFLTLRPRGWRRGLFVTDVHLKNFGVSGDRIVLLDAGGLTDRWEDVEDRLAFEDEVARPHVRLGLRKVLAKRPDIASRFDERWKATVNPEVVRDYWPDME